MRRKALARDTGIDDSYDVGTYPEMPDEISVMNVNNGGGLLKGALMGAALFAGGAGAFGLAGSVLSNMGVPKAPVNPPAVIQPKIKI